MRSPNCFIAKPKDGDRYSNKKDVGGVELITSASKEDHLSTQRIAVVLNTPVNYSGPVSIGDEIIVHHNTFRLYNDMKGKERSSWSFMFGDNYLIDPLEVYAYKSAGGDWNAIAPFCFVEPIQNDNSASSVHTASEEAYLFGIMVYPNSDQSDIKSGTKVGFTPDSEYEFNIEGRKLYRMKTNMICLKRETKY
jgi:hypothetical protein